MRVLSLIANDTAQSHSGSAVHIHGDHGRVRRTRNLGFARDSATIQVNEVVTYPTFCCTRSALVRTAKKQLTKKKLVGTTD